MVGLPMPQIEVYPRSGKRPSYHRAGVPALREGGLRFYFGQQLFWPPKAVPLDVEKGPVLDPQHSSRGADLRPETRPRCRDVRGGGSSAGAGIQSVTDKPPNL